jgi:pyridoxal phosphate enzyme (YggS family)
MLDSVQARIAQACGKCGREAAEITLLAVSKRQPAEAVKALQQLGLDQFGESYAAEGVEKIGQLPDAGITWHFIGPLQSNKTGSVAGNYDWMQSLDRLHIARRLNRQRPTGRAPLNVLIQVNIDAEAQKSGVTLLEVAGFADEIASLPALRLRGLMAIPRPGKPESLQRQSFAALRLLFEQLQHDHGGIDTLSMGMSDDLDSAIMEGSTMVRVGTALFGPRQG